MSALLSQSWKNVVVGFGTTNSVQIADFFSCVVDHFSSKSNSVHVICHLSNDVLTLSAASDRCEGQHNPQICNDNALGRLKENDNVVGPVILEHSPECPLRKLPEQERHSLISSSQTDRHIMLAVAILLESQDGKLLMTQRAEHMRSYPRVWVPPGGHLEKGEAIVACGLRELQEETGLTFQPNDIKLNLLCMWESVYPLFLPLGLPRHHHVTIYLHAKASQTSSELMHRIKCDPKEVMAYAWFTCDVILNLRNGKEDVINVFALDQSTPSGVRQEAKELGKMFQGGHLWTCGEIFSGTQQALTRWSESKKAEYSSKI